MRPTDVNAVVARNPDGKLGGFAAGTRRALLPVYVAATVSQLPDADNGALAYVEADGKLYLKSGGSWGIASGGSAITGDPGVTINGDDVVGGIVQIRSGTSDSGNDVILTSGSGTVADAGKVDLIGGIGAVNGGHVSLTGGTGTTGQGGGIYLSAGSGDTAGGDIEIAAGPTNGNIKLNDSQGTTRVHCNDVGIGFHGASPLAKPSVAGSRGGNVALANLLTALANMGLITNSTTA